MQDREDEATGGTYDVRREIGIGVIGLGWMGRVHTAAYKRAADHFPELRVRPRLVLASDVSPQCRAQAEAMGFEGSAEDWRAAVEHPGIDAVSITLPNLRHREVAVAAIEAGKHVWVEKPVGRGVEDTAAVADAARRAGVATTVGFCYRFAPAVAHARRLIADGAIGEVDHYRGVFLADYANRPDGAASWRFERAQAGSGALGDLMAHVVDLAQFLVAPIERLSGRTATMIPRRPRAATGEGTHFSRGATDDLVRVDNEDWAGALFEFAGGTVGSLEASRVVVGPRVRMRFEAHGTRGALAWELERMNELEHSTLSEDGVDDGYKTILAGPEHPGFAAFQPGAGIPMGYDDLRVLEAGGFLESVRDREPRPPGVEDMLACARVLDAIERSAASERWEPVGT